MYQLSQGESDLRPPYNSGPAMNANHDIYQNIFFNADVEYIVAPFGVEQEPSFTLVRQRCYRHKK